MHKMYEQMSTPHTKCSIANVKNTQVAQGKYSLRLFCPLQDDVNRKAIYNVMIVCVTSRAV